MIEVQLRRRGIRDERVLEAMFQVPRHEFVPPAFLNAAYEDRPLPIGQSETISQPYIVAAMTLAARVEAGDKALEVGTGSGYQAAILAYLGAKLYTVERNLQLAEAARERLARLKFAGIEVIGGDGSEGYPPAAPYQIILVTAAAPDVPPFLLDELAEGGRMVIPVGKQWEQQLYVLRKVNGRIERTAIVPVLFVPMTGESQRTDR